MMNMKRFFAFLLALSVLLGLVPTVQTPKAEAAISPSAATVTSLFQARSQDVHPRIMANDSDFARIRRLVQTDPYMKVWYAQLYAFGEEQLAEPLCKYEFPDGKKLLTISRRASYRIAGLAMLYQINGEARFADRAVDEMLNVCAFSDWHPSHYLDVGQMAYGVGLGYDWLYHYMTSSQRSTVAKAIYKYALCTRTADLTRITSTSNWNPWCNNGLIIAALAVFESYPTDAAATIADSVSYLPNAISVMTPSGSYPEGAYYLIVALSLSMAFSSLESVLGTDFGLSDLEGMRESAKFLLAINGYTNTFNHGDATNEFNNNAALHWYASRYNMPELSVFQRENHEIKFTLDNHLCLLWYDPALVEDVSNEDMQLDYLLMSDKYVSVASFRSFPGDAHQIYAAIKSGYNQVSSHCDMDIGTFVMEAMGELWFEDLGKDNYNVSKYFDHGDGGTRWTYYRKRTEGHNAIVINPSSDGGQDFDAKCQITDYQSAYDGGYATVNMKDAYDDYGATKATRSLALFDNRSRVRLRDEIVCSSASTIYWFAHTTADIKISSDGKTATLTKNGKTLLAQISGPAEAKFTQMSAKPLTSSPSPSEQNANAGYRKLVIKLTNTTKASINVVFTPVLSDGDKGKTLPNYSNANAGSLLQAYASRTTLSPNAEGVYEIYDVEQLCLFSQMVSAGETFSGKTVRLMEDIDMKGRSFLPIGGNGSGTDFRGTFDGNHHVVKNLFVFEPSGERVGFFGHCNGATVQNFGIESGTVFGNNASAGLMGYGSSVTVQNCFNRAKVISYEGNAAGLVGQLGGSSTILDSYNHADVKCDGAIAGGLVGYINSNSKITVERCYHVGNLKDTAKKTGLIGFYNTGSTNPIASISVKNCRSTVAIKSSEITANSSLESYSGNVKLTAAQLVSAAVDLGSAFIYDCEWENDGYPVLSWQCDTTLPEDLVLTEPAQLRLVAYMVCSGATDFKGQTLYLGNDIDLDSREWTPIGGNNDVDENSTKFAGTFDGQGYSISNMSITTGYYYLGFFGAAGGKIRNLGIRSGRVVATNKAGGLVGSASGTISDCYSRASVSGNNFIGGLVGMSGKTTVENSYTAAIVTATTRAGGIIGAYSSSGSNGVIRNCYSASTLSGGTTGGLVGYIANSASGITISDSYALNNDALVGVTTGFTQTNSKVLSSTDLKTKAEDLGASFAADSYMGRNGGYPVLTVSVYKSQNMQTLVPEETGEYRITNAQELRALAYMVNVEKKTFSGETVRLCSDIDLEYEEWIPIGGNSPEDGASSRRFSGTFEGDGHKISNLAVTEGNYYVGFFGDVTGATIRNFGVESGVVMGQGKVGGLAGTIRSNVLIENCYNKANVNGRNIVGGIVGMSSGKNSTVSACYNTGSVSSAGKAAGIMGYVGGSTENTAIKNCYNTGTQSYGILASAADTSTGSVADSFTVDSVDPVGSATTITLASVGKVTVAELRNLTQTLGTAYAEDYFVQNRLNPVLTWENGDRPTMLSQKNGVYQINTPDDLRLLSYLVRKGNSFSGESFTLTADLDMENRLWLPIGGKDETGSYAFSGCFHGQGHVISRVHAWEPDYGYAALFGIAKGSVIENLGVEDSTFIGVNRSGSFIGTAQTNTILRSCYSRATVYGRTITGGLVGLISGKDVLMENSYFTGAVKGEKLQGVYGGLVGSTLSNVIDFCICNSYSVDSYFGIIGSANSAATGCGENSYSVGSIKQSYEPNNFDLTNTAQISSEVMKTYASVLGTAFTEDETGENRGYPVLTWEIKRPPVLDETLKISHSLNLASDISVNFVVPKTLLTDFNMDTVYLETTVRNYEGNEEREASTVTLYPVEQGNYYYFTLQGLTAVQMNDRLNSILYGTKNGQVCYSPTDDYSIADYAYSQLNKTEATQSLKKLCAELLRYGSAAQSYKDYRTDALADSAMTQSHRDYLESYEAVTFGNTNRILDDVEAPTVTWVGKTLDLQSKVTVKYVFSLADYTGELSDLSLRVTYKDLYGETLTAVVTEIEDYQSAKGQYAFSFGELLAAELRTVLSARIYAGDTAVSPTMEYSPDTYGNNKIGTLLDLCKALFAYSDSAKAYFAN